MPCMACAMNAIMPRMACNIHSTADVRPLIAAVVGQAARDLLGENLIRKIDAAMFLAGDDFPLWAEAVGMPDLDGRAFLTSGRAMKKRVFRLID